MIFEVELLSGAVAVGQPFSLWDTHHRFDFQIAEVHQDGQSTRLVCTSDYLSGLSPETRFPDMFASKQVDTDDPKVAQSYSHKWSSQ